ncbi:MAG: diguanylate cyclase [Actinobacteria bacterium]|nr:diguanylate cyclase [Actinomycetota bacterium]
MNTVVRAVLALLAAAMAALTVLVVVGDAPVIVLDGLYFSPLVAAPVLCLARAKASSRDRGAWTLVGLGSLAWLLGDLYWSMILRDLDEQPFPSIADGLFLAFYPPVYLALVLMLRTRIPRLRAHIWLDGLMGALAVGAVVTAIVFSAVEATSEGDGWAIATNLAYPLADTILVALVVGALALTGWHADRSLAFLAAGFLLFGVTDALYLYQVAVDTYVEWTLVDVGWPVATMLMAFAAWQPLKERRASEEGWTSLVLPAVFAALGLAVLLWDQFEQLHVTSLLLACASVLVVIARMSITIAENLRLLARSREEALTDALTGLGNRRRLLVDLDRVPAGDEARPKVLVILDLNGFKAYNDAFGHPAGDALLARVGARLAAVARSRGAAYRLGGDEFCALFDAEDLPVEFLAEASAAAMRETGNGFAISAAYGAIRLPHEARTSSDALKLADQRMYAQKHGGRSSAGTRTSSALMQALTERSPDLGDHLLGVAELAAAVARKFDLSEVEVEDIRLGASLHDVGKMAIPDSILTKPGPPSDEEWAYVRNHTVAGEKILGAAPALDGVARLVRASHERFDGEGYPDGLAGEEIPLGARIVFVCDAFDAIIADRPYRDARSVGEAVEEIRRCAGTQFDPAVVEAFCSVMKERARLLAV